MERNMSVFVNRDREMQLVDDSFQILLDKERLLRNPILDFYGVSGIGKTQLLEQIKERCQTAHLPCIWINLAEKSSLFPNEIIDQVKGYLPKGSILFELT